MSCPSLTTKNTAIWSVLHRLAAHLTEVKLVMTMRDLFLQLCTQTGPPNRKNEEKGPHRGGSPWVSMSFFRPQITLAVVVWRKVRSVGHCRPFSRSTEMNQVPLVGKELALGGSCPLWSPPPNTRDSQEDSTKRNKEKQQISQRRLHHYDLKGCLIPKPLPRWYG